MANELTATNVSGALAMSGYCTSGEADVSPGSFRALGSSTGGGGILQLYNSADADGDVDYWYMRAWGTGELVIAADTIGQVLAVSDTTGDVAIRNDLSVEGDLNIDGGMQIDGALTLGAAATESISGGSSILTLDASASIVLDAASSVNGTLSVSGQLTLSAGIQASNLPTSDPSIAGRWYTSSGVVMVSAG